MKKFSHIKENLDKEFRLEIDYPVKVGDLKKLLSNIDDDKTVVVYNSGTDSNSWFKIKITNGNVYDIDDDIVLIYID